MSTINEFIEAPAANTLISFKKSEIMHIAKHYKLETKTSWVKQTLVNIVAQHILDEQLGGQEFEALLETEIGQGASIKLKELEIRSRELELQVKQAELEIEQQKNKTGQNSRESSAFDPSRVSRLVPPFKEDEIDQYFLHFEKVALNLKWPKDCWTTLLQTVFTGKARQAYNDLPQKYSHDYEEVKQTVLKIYELVPEAYRLKFRSCQMNENEGYVEFMRSKERLFNKWVTSKNVGNDYNKLRQLMLLEELKHCAHPRVKTFLDEQDPNDIYDAAEKADSYALIHKLSNKQNVQSFHNKYRPSKQPAFPENTVQSEVKQCTVKESVKPVEYCTFCKRWGHIDTECYSKARRDNRYRSTPVQCAVYPKHLYTPTHAPHTPPLEAETGNMVNIPHNVNNKVAKYTYDDVQRDFKPFLSDGYVSSVDGDNRTPIRILRDTGASRSLLLQGAVQLPDSSYTGERAIIQGMDMKYIPLPLHNIKLECGIVNGKVTVGILHGLPCEGISLLLGNDLAGDKVQPDPVVGDTPLTEIEHPEMCNVITRAASKRIEQSENVDVLDGLQDTFMSNTDTDIVHIQNQSCSKNNSLQINRMTKH